MTGSSPGWQDITAILRACAARSPDKTAIRFEDGSVEQDISFAQLWDEAVFCALDILSNDVAPGERAVLAYPPGIEFVIAYFGSLLADVQPIPLQFSLAPSSIRRTTLAMESAGASLILCKAAHLERLEAAIGGKRVARMIATDQAPEGDFMRLPKRVFEPSDTALIQFSSGSTGQPKGIAVSHANLVANLEMLRSAFDTAAADVAVSWLPHYHDMGLIAGILHSIYAGITTVLLPPVAFLRRPAIWPSAISRHRASLSIAPNFGYEHCARNATQADKNGLDLSCWNVAISGAERVRPETLDRFATAFGDCGFDRRAFYASYGLAEATLMVSGASRGAGVTLFAADAALLERGHAASAGAARSQMLVGCGPPRTAVRVVDRETLLPLGDDLLGEVCVAGACVAGGYWENGAARDFTVRLPLDPGIPFLRTGDIGFLHAGELFITGRVKDIIIIRGRNIFAEDIEAAVQHADTALREGCGAAFAIDDDAQERLVIVQEVMDAAVGAGRLAQMLAAVRDAVWCANEVVPASVLLVPPGQVPRTTSGKVQRAACRTALSAGQLRPLASWHADDGAMQNAEFA